MRDSNNTYQIDVTLGSSALSKLTKWLPLFYISEKLKKGFKEEIELREGLKIIINEYKPKKNLVIDFNINKAPCEFAICLSGRLNVEFTAANGLYDVLDISEGNAAFFYLPETTGVMKVFANEPLRIISIHCSPEFISHFFDGDILNLSNNSVSFNKKSAIPPFIEFIKVSQNLLASANQICDNTFTGAAKKMFLEGKSLELMTLIIDRIKNQNKENDSEQISSTEIKKANQVAHLLKSNLAEVPSLAKLADFADITHTRLNKAFRQVYGITVFGYLREIRLEKAKELLDNNEFSITEIAYEVGFSSPSHFSREFQKRYGSSPKSYSKLRK